ncbi:MAG: glutamate decarboxylase [Candidatus Woykebacteria bacterium RBG_13_40_7b]|uniref:Glutamate decarboxylase n=1 Tax=Candidatus Woykebacteria bacterium RBG_13_40_7b TaxID=1802594 RepID=A0A1G1WAC9_9BACT|nr:MAG: glutamate decarboxylase [Candidatus Woykebacteria bacterium RBG_13_40_7b]
MLHKKKKLNEIDESQQGHASTYGMRYFKKSIPKYQLPENEMPANAAYQLIHDELNLDGNPSLNLASFCTTWMEPEAHKLLAETMNKNFIDHDEYPQIEIIHERSVNMLARLFNAPEDSDSVGTATIGSSEAIMLGLLAHKWTWKNKRKAAGKPDDKPNIIFGQDVHICWDKFARYFDVEPRIIPMEKDRFVITAEEVGKRIDENTICVGAILGTTFTGQTDPIEDIDKLLKKVKKEKGWDIPIHVDAASGGFIAPFLYPKVKWDFRLERVRSINVSGHKYGLVYPGVGWLIFRDEKDVPEDIVFTVNYLGGKMPTYTLNFSRNSAQVVGQYYNFLRLGYEGYTNIMKNITENAQYLANKIMATGYFESLNPTQLLPVVAVKFKNPAEFTLYELSDKIREKGWIMPAYSLPPNAEDVVIMRIVVKENFSRDMCDMLYEDICEAYKFLKEKAEKNKSSNW